MSKNDDDYDGMSIGTRLFLLALVGVLFIVYKCSQNMIWPWQYNY